MTSPDPQPKRRGCLFYGGIVLAVLALMALLAGYAGYRFVRGLVDEYTDSKPLAAPAVQMSDTEIKLLQDRIQDFDKAMKENKSPEPLILTAEEINALIAKQNTNTPLSAPRLYFAFNENRVQAQLSVPADGLGLKMLRGRYFNGSGDFIVDLHDGKLLLTVKSLSVKGRPLPDSYMQSIRAQNFADGWTNDVEFTEGVAKLEEIKVENGKLVVVPKKQQLEAGK
jgi:hypothetical protein